MSEKQFIIEFYQEFNNLDFEKRWSTHILKKNSPQFLEDNSLSQLNNRSNTTRSHELEGTATKKNFQQPTLFKGNKKIKPNTHMATLNYNLTKTVHSNHLGLG
uniref:Uncharacterized protein n=1 Tax=Rhizophagus irregularis (strain DAOM 181602 / DAOM 197198 / MUCL 43194) TaxID=747089 RepID=U9T8V1_RHIID